MTDLFWIFRLGFRIRCLGFCHYSLHICWKSLLFFFLYLQISIQLAFWKYKRISQLILWIILIFHNGILWSLILAATFLLPFTVSLGIFCIQIGLIPIWTKRNEKILLIDIIRIHVNETLSQFRPGLYLCQIVIILYLGFIGLWSDIHRHMYCNIRWTCQLKHFFRIAFII